MPVLISVLIPVRDEKTGLRRAVESVGWIPSDRRFIAVDPRGGEGILELARSLAENVISHLYFDSAGFKNKAMTDFNIESPWLLVLDADEEVPEDLEREIRCGIPDTDFDGFYIPRRNLVGGKWVRRGGWYPDYNIRLFKPGLGKFEDRRVHSELKLDGKAGFLRNSILHHCRKNIAEHRKRVAAYARLKGLDAFDRKRPLGKLDLVFFPGFLRSPVKLIWRASPAAIRSLLLFKWLFFFKLGFLDGGRGFGLALAESSEPFLAARFYSRLELRRNGPGILRTVARSLLRGFFRRAVRLSLAPGSISAKAPAPGDVRNLLVVHLFGMGDVIMAFPFFERLRCVFPDAEITILARPPAVCLLAHCGFADSVLEYEGLRTLVSLRRELRDIRFELALLPFTGLSNYFAAKALRARAAAGYISGTSIETTFMMKSRPRDHGWNHPAKKALELLDVFGSGRRSFKPGRLHSRVELPQGRVTLVDAACGGESYVVLYPGGFSPSRRMNPGKAAVIADFIRGKLGYRVILVGDLYDRSESELIEAETEYALTNLTGFTDAMELAAVLGDPKCRLLVTGDSGVMHLASALAKPVVALFGPTSPSLRLPSGFRGSVLRTPRNCAPCFGGEHEPACRHRASCLDPIPDERIFEAVKEFAG